MLCSVCNTVCKLLKQTGFAEGQFRKIIRVEHLDQDRVQLHHTDPCLVLLPALLSCTSHTARFQTRCHSYATTPHIVCLCYLAPSVEVDKYRQVTYESVSVGGMCVVVKRYVN